MRNLLLCLITLTFAIGAVAEDAQPEATAPDAQTAPSTPPPAQKTPVKKRKKAKQAVAATQQTVSSSDSKIFNASLIPDVAIFGRKQKIVGFTLSIWGENEQQSFALGIVNGSTGNSSGLSLGIVNYADNYTGAMLSAVNWVKKDFVGFQSAFVNFVEGKSKGVQFGAVNYAGVMKGLQLGFVNYAGAGESGVQVGFINVIAGNKSFFGDFPKAVAPAMILANWAF